MKSITFVILSLIIIVVVGCGNEGESPQSAKDQTVEAPNLDLHAAIYMRDLEAIKQHIKAGSDLNIPEPSRKSSPLISAAFFGDTEAAKLLLNAGADINYQNLDGSTALQTAIVFGKTKVAKLLIESGADLTIKNKEGSAVLHTAAFFCHVEIVKELLKNGADKTIRNSNGKTAINIVEKPFEEVKSIYDAVGKGLKPLGIEFDYDHIKTTRPIIAGLLK